MGYPKRHACRAGPPPGVGLSASILLATLTTGFLGACGDGTGPSGHPARIESLVSSDLVAPAGELLPEPLHVRVSDARGEGLAGVEVEFLAFAENGAMRAENDSPADGDSRSTHRGRGIVVETDALGEARAVWELGYKAGPHLATVAVEGVSPLEVTAIAEPASPAILEIVSGHDQMGLVDQMLAEPLVARLRDRFGNRVPDASVDWLVGAGTGALSGSASLTDAAGEASIRLALGAEPGLRTVRASNGAIEPVEFVSLGVTELALDDAEDIFTLGISGDVVLPDILGLGAAWEGDRLRVGIMFEEPMAVAASRLPNRFGGLLDIDTDMDESTGLLSAVDINRPGAGSTGMGVDAYVDLFGTVAGDFVNVRLSPRLVGVTTPAFYGRLVTFTIPASIVGDGPMRMAMVVATHREPTDIAPEDGSLWVGARP